MSGGSRRGGEAGARPGRPSSEKARPAPRRGVEGGSGGGLPVCLGPGRLSKGEQESVDSELAGLSELWVEGGGQGMWAEKRQFSSGQ